jgi:hypothetical protein
MSELRQWATRWGDIASVIGVVLTILGFGVTIFGVWRSKSAAKEASQAATAARDSISRYDAIADLAAAMSIMDEIKRLQRNAIWAVLPDRYSELRRRLIAIKSSRAALSDAQHQKLEETVETFADLERRIERAVAASGSPPNPAKLNDIVSGQIDEVHAILLSLQHTLRQEQ